MRATLLIGLALLAGCNDRETPAQDGIDRAPIETAPPMPEEDMARPAETTAQADPQAPDPTPAVPAEPVDGSTIPAAIRGKWVGLKEKCSDRGAPLALEVTQDELLFHESVGTIRSVQAAKGDARQISADFTGEGQSWTRSLLLDPSAAGDRLTITQDGAAVTRKRCQG